MGVLPLVATIHDVIALGPGVCAAFEAVFCGVSRLAGARLRGYTPSSMLHRRRVLWLVCAALPGAALQLASCSSSEPSNNAQPDAAADVTPSTPIDSGGKRPDAGPDAQVNRTPPVLPQCLGTTIPLKTSGEKSYVKVLMSEPDAGAPDAALGPDADAGDASIVVDAGGPTVIGDFLIDFGANGSTVDLAGFKSTPPPTPSQCFGDAAAPGAFCYFPHFDFFGSWGSVGLATADYSILFSSVRQSGIIGTDFLAVYPFTLDYVNQKIWKATKETFCTDAQLLAAGFSPIPTGGFYTNDTKKLRPLSEVVSSTDAAVNNFVVPNIPTVPITVGGVSALAQLDTGYDDRIIRHSININEALLAQIQAKDPTLLTRSEDDDLFLTTCVPGLNQKGTAYKLRAGTPVNFTGEGGGIGRADTGNVLFVKEKVKDAERCGGIDTWTVPAAQMGASFLVDAQAVIFDPFASRVWIPK